jgi:hypothetical protein
MKKYRIMYKDRKYYPQLKGWFFWSYIEDDYMYGTGIIYFADLQNAKDYIKSKHRYEEPKVYHCDY